MRAVKEHFVAEVHEHCTYTGYPPKTTAWEARMPRGLLLFPTEDELKSKVFSAVRLSIRPNLLATVEGHPSVRAFR